MLFIHKIPLLSGLTLANYDLHPSTDNNLLSAEALELCDRKYQKPKARMNQTSTTGLQEMKRTGLHSH